MAESTTVVAKTNPTAQSCVTVTCDCNTMWSMAQQFCYLRLSHETGDHKSELIADYPTRARRIAGTYARFYLEQEEGCDPAKIGRFYWMALGAFASKTVACVFELRRVRLISVATELSNKLAKGNFWLFSDIAGWHWYYAKYPKSFDSCMEGRNAENYVPAVKKVVDALPWSAQSLPVINNLKASDYIRSGFRLVKKIENTTNQRQRPGLQLEHLMEIAWHEQGVVLQPLIYADKSFADLIEFQRAMSWLSPTNRLVFSRACETPSPDLESVAPDQIELENLKSRMTWIGSAARKFHALMQEKPAYMGAELAAIAAWAE